MNYSSNFEKLVRKEQDKLIKFIEKKNQFLWCELIALLMPCRRMKANNG